MNAANESSPAPSLRRLPFLIRLSPAFINRASAVLANSENTGGISGLLFGVIESDFALVQAFRQLPSRAPGASGRAEAKLPLPDAVDQLVAASKKDQELSGLALLGWYSSRSVSGLQAEDVDFHQKVFSKPNDLALIVKPEPPGEVGLEIYSRTLDGVLSNEGHRWGSVRISCDSPVSSPVEVPMRAKIHDDFYMRAYQFADPAPEEEAGPRWKDAFASTTKRAFELLKTVKPDDRQQAAALAKRESKDVAREKPEIVRSTDQPFDEVTQRDAPRHDGPHIVTSGGGAAAAPARAPSPKTSASQPIESPSAITQKAEPARAEPKEVPPAQPTDRDHRSIAPPAIVQPQLAAPPPSASVPSTALALTSSAQSPYLSSAALPALAPQYATRKDREIPWVAMAAVFAVTAAATFGFISLRSAHSSGTLPGFLDALWPTPGLALKLSNEGNRIQLSWNPNNAAVRTAGEALLEIYDGPDHRQVRLTARELANGSVLYRPNTDDVVFHLEVHGVQGQNASETKRVFGTSKPPILDVSQPRNVEQPATNPKGRPDNPKLAPGQLQLDARNTIDPSRLTPIKPKSDRGQASNIRSASKPSAIEQAPSITQPPANNLPEVTPPPVEATPTQTRSDAGTPPANAPDTIANPTKTVVTESVPPQNPLTIRETPPPATNVAPKADIPVAAPPVSQTSKPSEVPAPNSSGSQTLADYVAPRPLRQIMPSVKSLPIGLRDTSGQVKVLVRVDESGHVSEAKIIEGTKSVNSLVKNAALVAAQQWTFEPASLHGRKIVSDHTILFQFRR